MYFVPVTRTNNSGQTESSIGAKAQHAFRFFFQKHLINSLHIARVISDSWLPGVSKSLKCCHISALSFTGGGYNFSFVWDLHHIMSSDLLPPTGFILHCNLSDSFSQDYSHSICNIGIDARISKVYLTMYWLTTEVAYILWKAIIQDKQTWKQTNWFSLHSSS